MSKDPVMLVNNNSAVDNITITQMALESLPLSRQLPNPNAPVLWLLL